VTMEPKAKRRWKRAQLSERKYHQRFTEDRPNLSMEKSNEDRKYFLERYSVDIDALLSHKSCLEIGGGPFGSNLVQRLCQRVNCKVVSIDPLPALARPSHTGQSLQLIRGIGEFLLFKDASFDIVLCSNVLDHVITPVEVLKEIKRVLAHGASLFLWVHSYKIPKPMLRLLSLFDSPHPHHFSPQELILMLEREGYKVVFHRFTRPKLSIRAWVKASNWLSAVKYLTAYIFFNIFESSFCITRP